MREKVISPLIKKLMGCGLRKKGSKTMTKRDFYNAIVTETELTEEMKEFAQKELEKLDASLEKRRNTLSKKAQENLPLLDRIYNEILDESPKTATDVAEIIEVSVQKASALLRNLTANGKATQTEKKIPKKGLQKAYVRNFVTE